MVEPQESADGLVLHLIRTIALYLFVFLSQTTVADAELAVLVANCTTTDLDEQTTELQCRLHAALVAWGESEVNNNQFDGLLQEQRAFVVIKRLFRQQRVKAAAQCRVLAALLACYLARIETPLVRCEPASMLSSTLEYLLAKEKEETHQELVPLPMLYPLVNAVDLATIEQRECLDALINVLRWLSAHDETQKVFTTFASKYHTKVIEITEDGGDALGVCFVQMLVRYSDHIFRRDPQFEDMVPTLSYSDTEDDDASSEENCARFRHAIPDNLSEGFAKIKTNETKQKQDVFKPSGAMQEETNMLKGSSKATRQAKSRSLLIGKRWGDEEPLPAVVCVGIAATAGTLAALCAFFN